MAADSSSHSHSGGIQLASIPILEDQSNWEDWIRNAGGWLISHDYDEEAPVAPAPAARGRSANDAADPYTKMLATWKNGQKKAVTGLKSRCGKRAYGLVKTITDLSRLLETLEANFKPKGEGIFNEIYNRWENINLEECKDVNDYCTQFDQICAEFAEIDSTCVFPRSILVKKFLQGLGPAFSTWQMSFYQQHNIIGDNGVTLCDAQSGARVEEQRLKSNNATTALLATNKFGKRPREASTSGPPVPGGRWCHNNCRHAGHWDRECWIQHPELKLIWEAQNPERAAARRAKRTRTNIPPPSATQAHVAAPTQAHAAVAVTSTRTSNLF